jgi:hypothetical protein
MDRETLHEGNRITTRINELKQQIGTLKLFMTQFSQTRMLRVDGTSLKRHTTLWAVSEQATLTFLVALDKDLIDMEAQIEAKEKELVEL